MKIDNSNNNIQKNISKNINKSTSANSNIKTFLNNNNSFKTQRDMNNLDELRKKKTSTTLLPHKKETIKQKNNLHSLKLFKFRYC